MTGRWMAWLAQVLLLAPGVALGQAAAPDPESPRPIDAFDSVWIGELAWMELRRRSGLFTINGVPLDPAEKTLALARDLVDYQAEVTVEAIRRAPAGGERP